MKETVCEIIAVILTIVFVIIIGIIANKYIPEENTEQMEECEHEWVVTSEFSLLSTTGYRTVSKCIKCGKVIR